MALYWPDKKVALDITDDPDRKPLEGDASYNVLTTTIDDLSGPETYERVKQELLDALGTRYITDPVYSLTDNACASKADELVSYMLTLKKYTVIPPSYAPDDLETVEILASNDVEAACMTHNAKLVGQKVRGVTMWDGPVPEGSFVLISPAMRMSTPEYFFLRKANQMSLPEAVELGLELCGKFRTKVTQYDLTDTYDFLHTPRTTKAKIAKYLRGCADTKEGRRAKRVLRLVGELCPSPASAWFFMMLSLPVSHGGYGLPMPEMAKAFSTNQGYLPPTNGDYVIYDLTWKDQWVSLQYIGAASEYTKDVVELRQGKMHVILVTDECMADPKLLDDVARKVANRLHRALPKRDEKWSEINEQLREHIPVPTFDNMRLTMDDISHHFRDD